MIGSVVWCMIDGGLCLSVAAHEDSTRFASVCGPCVCVGGCGCVWPLSAHFSGALVCVGATWRLCTNVARHFHRHAETCQTLQQIVPLQQLSHLVHDVRRGPIVKSPPFGGGAATPARVGLRAAKICLLPFCVGFPGPFDRPWIGGCCHHRGIQRGVHCGGPPAPCVQLLVCVGVHVHSVNTWWPMWLHVSKGVCLGLACAGLQGVIAPCLLAQLPVSTVRVQRIDANAAHKQMRVILVRASGATVGSAAEQQRGWAGRVWVILCGCCAQPACVQLCIWGPLRGASDCHTEELLGCGSWQRQRQQQQTWSLPRPV